MKKFVTLLVTLLVIASLSFCAVAEEKPFAGQTLTISTFSFNAELLQKNVYDPFEAATGAKLVVDTGRNPERVTKIVESPEDYDVVIIGDMFVDQLREAGVLETFDSSKLSNISGIYENARAPMGEVTARPTPSTASASSMTARSATWRSRALPTCGTRSWRAASPCRK